MATEGVIVCCDRILTYNVIIYWDEWAEIFRLDQYPYKGDHRIIIEFCPFCGKELEFDGSLPPSERAKLEEELDSENFGEPIKESTKKGIVEEEEYGELELDDDGHSSSVRTGI